MILDSITLTNFGLYVGDQTITLTPPSPEKPIVLFGGLNGGGKTTLLDALQLCLFGGHAKTASRGRLGYQEYLSRCIYDRGECDSAGLELRFRQMSDGSEDQYILRRRWERTNGRCKEEFLVLKNDRLAPALAENWSSHVEELLPVNIAHLFLFDGEQIERYASSEDSAVLIGTAIQNLLGLDLVERLDKDIVVFERRKRSEQLNPEGKAKVVAAENELKDHRRQLEHVKRDCASLRTHRLERRRRELVAVEQEFRRLGGNLYESRRDIEAKLADSEHAIEESSANLRELASGPLPLLLLTDLLESAMARDRDEQMIVQARQMHDLLGERDRAVLEHLKSISAAERARNSLRDYLQQDRTTYAARAARTTKLELASEARTALTLFLQGQREDLRHSATGQSAVHSSAKTNVEHARGVYHSIPSHDTLSDVVERRESLRTDIAGLESEYESMQQEIERLQREIERSEQSLAKLVEADVKDQQRRDDRDRVVACAQKVRVTLAAFRDATIKRHVARIEHLVLESYQHLLRKTSLVTRLSIDIETFSVTLFGRTGEALRAESLSAGERQLLGIALLWGLAKASGRPLPTAIDTPLGRLDTEHRRHFVDRYLPFASHQTLVFSTNEEIVGEHLERLEPWIGHRYHLSYDDSLGQTHVTPGYFEGEQVANGD